MSHLLTETWLGKEIPYWGHWGKIILPIVLVLSLVVSAFGTLIGSSDIASWGMAVSGMLVVSVIFSTFTMILYGGGMASLGLMFIRRKYKVEKLSDSIPAASLFVFVTIVAIVFPLNIAKLFSPILGDSWSLLGLAFLVAEFVAVQWYRGYVRRSRRFGARRAPEVPPEPPPPPA